MSRENQGIWKPVEKPAGQQDTRFAHGTSYSSTYKVPPPNAYAYKALPASHLHLEQTGSAVLDSNSNLFPTLTKTLASVTLKMAPRIGNITAILRVLDAAGTGFINEEQLVVACREVGVMISETDLKLLLSLAKRDQIGNIDYVALADSVLGRDKLAAAAAKLTSGALVYSWPSEDSFQVELKGRPEQPIFSIPAWRMVKFAQQATWASQEHGHPGKVALVVNQLLHEALIVLPEASNETDMSRTGAFDLSFRNWIYCASTSSLRMTQRRVPGPNAAEVADVFDQVIHGGLRVQRVISHTHTPLPPTTMKTTAVFFQ